MPDSSLERDSAAPDLSVKELEDLVIDSDRGARQPTSKFTNAIIISTALLWSLFQLWIASPLNYSFVEWFNSLNLGFDINVLNHNDTRSIHLGFSLFLAFLAYPAFNRSPRRYIPIHEWAFALIAAGCALYYFIFSEELALRSGRPIQRDVIAACLGLLLLLEATRRALGYPLVIIAAIMLMYTYFGNSELIPDIIRHKGQSLNKIASHMWLTPEGVFGVALGVSTSFVFLFVLFGALLDKAGAGNYFIKVAFSLLGHMRGGPAKAAVLSSAMTGMISGSSIANVVTTGTFTIPLMKRVGFNSAKAGAVEVAASVNGQLMPPVMGAAAFLMIEYVGISYLEVIKHAFIPAFISYIALLYMVHLEAVKLDMPTLKQQHSRFWYQSLLAVGITLTSIVITAGVIYFLVSCLKVVFSDHAATVFITLLSAVYIGCMWYVSRFPDLEKDEFHTPILTLPSTAETVRCGLHYILPIAVLVWCLMIERLSPGLSAFWAVTLMIIIVITQPMLKSIFRKKDDAMIAFRNGYNDLIEGLIAGARNMIGIGVATAAAGIIVGVVSLTGIGNVLTEVIEAIAGDSLFLILLLTAVICLILGMGLPTTANYIVVATLMAHVVRELAERNGLYVPLIVVHMFVFYFGIMADITPPVGLAAFAAAAISGANPMRSGIQAFMYSLRMAILPFFFIFNTELLLIGVDSIWYSAWVLFYASVAILLFSAAVQGYFILYNKWYETIALLLISFTLFMPSFWNNWINPPYKKIEATEINNIVLTLPEDHNKIMLKGQGENEIGVMKSFHMYIPSYGKDSIPEIFKEFGLLWDNKGKDIYVRGVQFGSDAYKKKMNFSYVISDLGVPQEQPKDSLMYIPAIILLLFVVVSQARRRQKEMIMKIS